VEFAASASAAWVAGSPRWVGTAPPATGWMGSTTWKRICRGCDIDLPWP
jgi:hypothetical protein